jgi:hypothetical protein
MVVSSTGCGSPADLLFLYDSIGPTAAEYQSQLAAASF